MAEEHASVHCCVKSISFQNDEESACARRIMCSFHPRSPQESGAAMWSSDVLFAQSSSHDVWYFSKYVPISNSLNTSWKCVQSHARSWEACRGHGATVGQILWQGNREWECAFSGTWLITTEIQFPFVTYLQIRVVRARSLPKDLGVTRKNMNSSCHMETLERTYACDQGRFKSKIVSLYFSVFWTITRKSSS